MWDSYMEPQSSQTIPRIKKCPFLKTWAWKFALCHFCDIVSIKEILEPARIQGEGPWISHTISWWQVSKNVWQALHSILWPQIIYIPLTCKIQSLSSQISKCIIPSQHQAQRTCLLHRTEGEATGPRPLGPNVGSAQRHMHPHVHSSIIYSSQDMKAT